MKTSIIKPSAAFKRNALKKNAIVTAVDTFLYQINSAIEGANKDNRNKTAIRLPSSFSIPDGIDSNNFRIEVYYNIVNILENKGYSVKIKTHTSNHPRNAVSEYDEVYGDNNILYISWNIDDDFDKKTMLKKLSNLTI